jgi:hypothetical protein
MSDQPANPLLRTVKSVLPKPVKVALRPAVQAVAPSLLTPPARSNGFDWENLSFCDKPVGNKWTVVNPQTGSEHKFFFLCGCWKSGTHWVQAILNLHPKVNIHGEYHFEQMLNALDRFTTPGWFVGHRPRGKRAATEAMENLIRRTMYATSRDAPEATWLGDRSPRHLRPVLQGAPHYWLIRDGRDVLISYSWHWLRANNASIGQPWTRRLVAQYGPEYISNPERFRDPNYGLLGDDEWVRQSARAWARYVDNDFGSVDRIRAEGTPVMKIVYEQLHAKPHEGAAEIFKFLGLDPAEADPLSEETKTLPGFKKEDLKSRTRKGQAGDWQNYFNDRLTRIFKEEAGEALIRAGYEKDLNW